MIPGNGYRSFVSSWLQLVLLFFVVENVVLLVDGRRVIAMMAAGHHRTSTGSSTATTTSTANNKLAFELIGATGRIGSLFTRQEGCLSLPRHAPIPGSSSSAECPIVVATPSTAWHELHQASLRPDDMVYIGNGIPSAEMVRQSTLLVPHFGILLVGGPVVSSSLSPPTYVSGRHATWVADILSPHGIRVEIVQKDDSHQIMMMHAVRKLLWASCFWLLCHHNQEAEPLTVSQVHQERQDDLEMLVKELWPVVLELTGADRNEKDTAANNRHHATPNQNSSACGLTLDGSFYEMSATLDYLQSYSLSMPNAVPSLPLALSEVHVRNGVFYRDGSQPFHQRLLLDLTKDATIDALNKRMRQGR